MNAVVIACWLACYTMRFEENCALVNRLKSYQDAGLFARLKKMKTEEEEEVEGGGGCGM